MEESLRVVVRVRPPSNKQLEAVGLYEHFLEQKQRTGSRVKLPPQALAFFSKYHSVRPDEAIRLKPNSVSVCDQEYKNTERKARDYFFSAVLEGHKSNQQLFEECLRPELPGLLQGTNCTVMAYGITGSGKTFSVFGHPRVDRGLCHLAFEFLLTQKQLLQSRGTAVELRFSFIEIYNQNVRDLLSEDGRKLVTIGQDKGVVALVDATEVPVASQQQLVQLVSAGTARRTSAATEGNPQSSRSHAILRVAVEIQREGVRTSSKLFIIDLAGSEKLSRESQARRQEGTNINRSLLALGNCINALADNQRKNSTAHVPYRDSKLTRLLKDSLGGSARTVMVACISPHPFTLDETITTLNYAERAQGIRREIPRPPPPQPDCPRCRALLLSPPAKPELREAQEDCPPLWQTPPVVEGLWQGAVVGSPSQEQSEQCFWQLCEKLYQDILDNSREAEQIERLRPEAPSGSADFEAILRENEQQRLKLKEVLFGLLAERGRHLGTADQKPTSARKRIRLSSVRKPSDKENPRSPPTRPLLETQDKANLSPEKERVCGEFSSVPLQQLGSSVNRGSEQVVPKRRRSKFEVVPRPGRRLSENKSVQADCSK